MEQQNYMVCVSCMTYNHAPYITDALNGFCMQETTFPFVCTIVDDASTDGEQDVIKKYLQDYFDLEDKAIVRNEETDDYILTFARHKTNKNCFFAVLYLKYNHYKKKSKMPYVAEWRENCKYIALCEGDDYWIVKDKLHKQVEFLDAHLEVSLSHTAFLFLYQERKVFDKSNKSICRIKAIQKHTDNYIPYILNGNDYRIQTCSVIYRVSSQQKVQTYLDEMKGMFLMTDTQLWCLLNYVGKIHFIDEYMCVYRVHENSQCHPIEQSEKLRFRLSCAEMRIYMGRLLDLSPKDMRKYKKSYIKCLASYIQYNSSYDTIVSCKMNAFDKVLFVLYKNKIGRMCIHAFERTKRYIVTIR